MPFVLPPGWPCAIRRPDKDRGQVCGSNKGLPLLVDLTLDHALRFIHCHPENEYIVPITSM